MNKFASLLAITLLLAGTATPAEADGSDDLRYCLDLPSAQQIAKCAGEISAGGKGQTYSKEEVESILSEEQANTPASANDPSDTPAAIGFKSTDAPPTERE